MAGAGVLRDGQQCGASCCQNGRFRGENTAARTAAQCILLSEWAFSGRKYSGADCSAVHPAVKMGVFGAKIQRGGQQCGAFCCQNGLPEGKNTAVQ